MCNINDYMKQLSDYVGFMSNERTCITPIEKKLFSALPISITSNFFLCKGQLFQNDVIYAIANSDYHIMPVHTEKLLAFLEQKFGCPIILVANDIVSYNLGRLVEKKVNFIIPQKQMFIPSLMLNLKKVRSTDSDIKEFMPPLAQCILLYHIQTSSLDAKDSKGLCRIFNVSYATVNRALRWLNKHELITLEGDKTKVVRFFLPNKELWNTSLPLFRSPVEKILYTDSEIQGALEGGVNALSEYTMLNKDKAHCYVLSKGELKALTITTDSQYGENKIELWRYSPHYFSDKNFVDRLSLYLSLKDSQDERIQIELGNLIDKISW